MCFTLDPEATVLTAVRIVNGNPITYTNPAQDRPAIVKALTEAHALGHLTAPESTTSHDRPSTLSPWPENVHHGVLDLLDAEGLLVQDFPLPTEAAFAWVKNRLGLTPAP